MEDQNYKEIARQSRIKVIDLIYRAQTSHVGSNLSCADIMAVLFEKIDLDKDKFVLSAGWKAAMLYYHLWRKGRITEEELDSYCQPGSKWIGLSEPIHPDIPFAGGSMGMGLPAAVGFALAKKLKNEEGKVYALESDGGVQTGTFWESVIIASQNNLDNLFLIIDDNGFCAMGETKKILDLYKGQSLKQKLSDFGWDSFVINGHDYESLESGFKFEQNMPTCMIAKTIKGYPISFMSRNNLFHYKSPSFEEYRNAMLELSKDV